MIFLGSPRKNGNTETLVQSVMAGVEEVGGTSELIRLSEYKINPCVGCGGCEKEGNCVIQDDMQDMYPRITAADRIIVASPKVATHDLQPEMSAAKVTQEICLAMKESERKIQLRRHF